MIPKVSLIVALCSIPLVFIIITPQTDVDCQGNAMCLKGKVTKIVDGDTLDVGDIRIRLALTSTPELGDIGGIESKMFVEEKCPVNSDVLVDEDDGQIEGSYGRIIGKVFCKGNLLNEEILKKGYGEIERTHCFESEFREESWAKKFGC
ncbi:MAG: thermonuclease family protein [Nitrosopumilus sp.]